MGVKAMTVVYEMLMQIEKALSQWCYRIVVRIHTATCWVTSGICTSAVLKSGFSGNEIKRFLNRYLGGTSTSGGVVLVRIHRLMLSTTTYPSLNSAYLISHSTRKKFSRAAMAPDPGPRRESLDEYICISQSL